MQMNILVLILLLLFFYLGFTRGFFSMLLHLGVVIVAGAIAFAIWEPVGYMILGMSKDMEWLTDIAWGVALGVPFALILAVLLGAVTATVRNNVQVPSIANYIGGGILGLSAGVIVSGIAVISVSFMRSSFDLLDYTSVKSQANGSLVRDSNLWVPVDRLTAGMYQFFSQGTLSSGTPLAKFYPDLVDRPHLMNARPDNAVLKTTLQPDALDVIGRYTIGEKQSNKLKYNELVTDKWSTIRQTVSNLDGTSLDKVQTDDGSPIDYYIEGIIVNFKSAAREQIGQIAVGPGSATLIAAADDGAGKTVAVQPYALISEGSMTIKDKQGNETKRSVIHRWRFDSKNTFMGSVGGATGTTPMAFEFLVPKGSKPLSVFIRGVRVDLQKTDPESNETVDSPKPRQLASTAERDEAIQSILSGSVGNVEVDWANAVIANIKPETPEPNYQVVIRIPFSGNLNKGNATQFKYGGNNGRQIQDGEATMHIKEFGERIVERDLRVDEFYIDNSTAMVQIDVGNRDSRFYLLNNTAGGATGAPLLKSTTKTFACVGYVYKDNDKAIVRYTPGRTVDNRDDIPSLSKSRSDQQLILLFRVDEGAVIEGFAIGTTGIVKFQPPQPARAIR